MNSASSFGPPEFAAFAGVSRETLARFETYAALLSKWTRAINLVAASTVADLWQRHFWDSAQLRPLIAFEAGTILDVGSGAGFPGLVLAILKPDIMVHLCEADQRKATFLREVARATETKVTVHAQRVETLEIGHVDLITARAWAPVAEILNFCERIANPSTQFLLLKGRQAHKELTDAQKIWNIDAAVHKSRSDDSGVIVQIIKASRHDRRKIRPSSP